jgi:hypothetical protein
MAARPNKPNIQKSPNADNQPPPRIIENQPAASVDQALANSKRQVDEANAAK